MEASQACPGSPASPGPTLGGSGPDQRAHLVITATWDTYDRWCALHLPAGADALRVSHVEGLHGLTASRFVVVLTDGWYIEFDGWGRRRALDAALAAFEARGGEVRRQPVYDRSV